MISGLSVPGFKRGTGAYSLWGCLEARQSLAIGGERVGTQRRRVVCGRRGPAGEETTFGRVWPRSGQLQVSLPPSVAGRPRPLVGVGKENRRGCTDS